MKTKTIRVTLERRVGLPNYSSAMMSITEDVELDEDDKAPEVRGKIIERLKATVSRELKILVSEHAKEYPQKK